MRRIRWAGSNAPLTLPGVRQRAAIATWMASFLRLWPARRPVHTHCVGGRHDVTAPAFLAFLARGDARIRRCWILEGWRESSGADLPGVAKMWASSGSTLEKGTPHLGSMCVRSTERGPFVRSEMIIGRPYRP